MDPNQPDRDTLWSTNRLLSDLERKLSIVSNNSASSNQTQHSQSSSVIVDRNFSGIAKENVQSSVLQYIKSNENEFNPNELFEERQQKFLTKLGRTYNDDKFGLKNNEQEFCKVRLSVDDSACNDDSKEVGSSTYGDRDTESNHEPETPDMTYDDEDDTYIDDGEGDDKMFFDDDDDDLLLSPEPPRSPPREIDPDKVYGLYDFSGPDPLHCTLTRDEPVYLINDEDNYWCLIKKLSKEERIEVLRIRQNVDGDIEDPFDDEEYEKIGFVPAECLESYEERLARLNCFKNEELEKLTRENTDNNDLIQILGEPFSTDENSQAISSLNNTSTTGLVRKNMKANKSVTFEDLGILDFYDEDDGVNKGNGEFGQHLLSISHDELQSLSLPRNEEDKTSEVLSDVYPTEMPLIIKKNNKKSSPYETIPNQPSDSSKTSETNRSIQETNSPEIIEILDPEDDIEVSHVIHINKQEPEINSNVKPVDPNEIITVTDSDSIEGEKKDEEHMFNNPYSCFVKPPTMKQKDQDNSSIGSFSPDTPPQRKTFSSSNLAVNEQVSNDLSSLRRSDVLDRLNKITFDIQEQLKLNDYGSFNEESNHLLGVEKSMRKSSDSRRIDFESEDDDEYNFDDYAFDDDYYYRNESDPDDQGESEDVGIITPLTSSNSLSNAITPIRADSLEKRKSKPVHEMFVPVLGKFDLLAEKLARLDELI